jgi:PHD/YefM family antitoxin component YafN of YafNO toxin-antitoxin module
MPETITIKKEEFEQMQRELDVLRKTSLYKRLLEFEQNISEQRFTRKDLGF